MILTLQLFYYISFKVMLSFSFIIIQVVGGIDDQIPSLPPSTGVKVVTYSKLLSQVILFFLMNQPNP